MTAPNLNWIANYIWGIANDVLRDVYVRGKYRDVILPMTVLRRLDAVLEPTKQAVLDMRGHAGRRRGHEPGRPAPAGDRAGLPQHCGVCAQRPPGAWRKAATQSQLRGLPRRILAQRA